jgi:hypothetical protein
MAMRTCRSGVDLSTQLSGVDADAARAAEGIHDVLRIGADDFDLLGFGFAVGFYAQVDGHAEEVEVLLNFADGAEALVVAEAVDGVLVVNCGAPVPSIHWAKEGG